MEESNWTGLGKTILALVIGALFLAMCLAQESGPTGEFATERAWQAAEDRYDLYMAHED